MSSFRFTSSLWSLALFCIAPGFAPTASAELEAISAVAAQTDFPMNKCENCSAAQMQTAAAQAVAPGNYIFIYSLSTATVRKYRVYLESTCKYDPLPEGKADTGTFEERTESNPVPLCGAVKAAIEAGAVDASLRRIFDSMLSVHRMAPSLLANGAASWWTTGNGLNRLPNDPSTGQPYNYSDIAWDLPGGAGYRFMEAIRERLENESMLRDTDPAMADLIYGVWFSSVNVQITISAAPGSGGAAVTVGGNVQLDTEKPVRLKVCNSNGDCVTLSVTRNRTQVSVTLETIVDRHGNIYPMPNYQRPSVPSWNFPGGGGATDFGRDLNRHGVQIWGAPGDIIRSCAWVGGHLMGCSWSP